MSTELQISPELLELMQDDPEFCKEISGLFESDGRKLLGDLKTHIETADCVGIEKSTHALKGIFSNTGLDGLRTQMLPLVTYGHDNTLAEHQAEATEIYQQLCTSFEQAVAYFQELANS